ncbi:MAG: hypothetical protein ACJA0Q_001666 [Saprospiraceae bacterium]|jgi:hypothetical protein
MAKTPAKSKKKWLLILFSLGAIFTFFFAAVLLFVYSKQDEIIQSQIDIANEGQSGIITIGNTHLDPFKNFPYISIKIDDVKILEDKSENAAIILDVADIYIGFELTDVLQGNFDVHTLLIEDGFLNYVWHKDGTNNIANAIAKSEDNAESEPLNIHLQNITFKNIDLHKFDEISGLDVETFIYSATGEFKSAGDIVTTHVDSKFEMNIIDKGDTTFVKHKHFEFHTDFTFNTESGLMTFKPSGIIMEHGDFELEGTYDTKNEKDIDFNIKGTKPNFDMLIAFAPQDIIPVLEKYKNAGEIYFNASIKGSTAHGEMPLINVEFGASEAYLENTGAQKRLDNMGFKGHFTNGEKRNIQSMEFSLIDMTASLEKGNILGAIIVKNFEEPEIDMSLKADFDLAFLAKFFNLTDFQLATGQVHLDMKFHDVIDLDHPEHALKKINQAYFCELKIEDLSFTSVDLPAPLKKLNMHITMRGKEADINLFDLKIGESDLFIKGYLSDLPAVIHHSNKKIKAHLEISSKLFDLAELTKYSKKDSIGIDETIENLSVGFSFVSSARAFTEFKYLPVGEFFIDSLHAQLKHYPHELHDFHVDVLVDDQDLRIKDFTGFIDKSDFHFNGLIHDYGFWMQDSLNGDVDMDITLHSNALHLESIFSYQGENYVPEDYRHEEFDNLVLHVNSSMHYKNHELHSIDVKLDQLSAKMHLHPFRFENFKGRFHYEDEHLMIQKFHGKMGRTVFNVDMNYYLGKDQSIKKRDNHLELMANYIDFDELFSFNTAPPSKTTNIIKRDTIADLNVDIKEHAEAFNLYELPFTDMQFDVEIGHFIHHRIDLKNINAKLRTTQNHYIYVDTLSLNAAGGSFNMSGYFNGSDPKHIYLKPKLAIRGVDIDKLFFKFENFGQDALVSDNVHGKLTALIKGKIRMYPDLVPDLDQSEIHMDIELLNGSLQHFEPMDLLSEYVGEKDLTNIKFDTLKNHMDITNGLMNIPNMTLESTLGHFDISGQQDMNNNIEYYVRIPWKLIRSGAKNKLFGSKEKAQEAKNNDKIVKLDRNKKTRYLNLKIHGNIDNFEVSLGKDKRKKK